MLHYQHTLIVLLTGKAMKSFLKRLAALDQPHSPEPLGCELRVERLGRVGGRRSFRNLDVGGTAALNLSKGMRSPASPKRDVDNPLKKPAREPWNERKDFMSSGSFNVDSLVFCIAA